MTQTINPRKAAIIGCGFVGSATAFTLMQSRLFSELVLLDANEAKADGEAKDIAHGIPFSGQMKIYAGTYDDIADSAIIIITAVAFGPEAGFLTGALTAFVSNFIFGQGPWTPWQMFTWGLVGFLAGILQNAGVFRGRSRRHFAAQWWDRLCPENTNRGDLLHFVRQLTDHAPLRLCLYGFLSGFLYGWIMNLYFIIGYVSPLTWQTIGAAYLSSFFFDFCHGLCTFLVLWALGDPWVRKLERIKIKFGLTAEERNYVLPPSTFEIARENYE